MPLQRAIAGSGASSLHGHAVRRYGPGDAGVSVVPDSLTQRILVPRPGAPPASELGRGSLGQFANDLAFERGLLGRRHAALEYETASAASNSLSLVWELTLLPPRRGGGGAAGADKAPSKAPASGQTGQTPRGMCWMASPRHTHMSRWQMPDTDTTDVAQA